MGSCGVPIVIVIDPNGKMATDEWLDENDVDKYKAFLDSVGYAAIVERATKPFKNSPALFKKKMVKDIDWSNPRIIRIVLENEALDDDAILKKMGIERAEGSGVVITFRLRSIRREFLKWAALENIEKSNHEKYYDRFAEIYVKTQKKPEILVNKVNS